MRFAMSPRDLAKTLRRLGLKVETEDVKASRIVIETEDGRRLLAEPDQLVLLKVQGQYYLMIANIPADGLEEERVEEQAAPKFSEEDVRLVAEQAGVSLEEARKALEETGGDIAAAILKLMEKKG